jgi:hypothetical protein
MSIFKNLMACFDPQVHLDSLIDKQRNEIDMLELEAFAVMSYLTQHIPGNGGKTKAKTYRQGIYNALLDGDIEKAKNIVFLGSSYDPNYNHEEIKKQEKRR